MYTIHRNKMNIKDKCEDTVCDWTDDIIALLNEHNPKDWRKIITELQKAFILSSESLLEDMYDEKGWD